MCSSIYFKKFHEIYLPNRWKSFNENRKIYSPHSSYYCDVCNSLEELHQDDKLSNAKLTGQFTDISCPNKPGVYSLTRKFCFNDFNEFDKDGDCQFDFLQDDGLAKQYKDALKNLQQVGYVSECSYYC